MRIRLLAPLVAAVLVQLACGNSVAGAVDGGAGGGSGGGAAGGSGADGGRCASNQTECGAACVNLAGDPANCGMCGHACSSGDSCANGTCSLVDCRQAGVMCGAGTFCSLNSGQCLAGCAADDECAANSVCDLATHGCVCATGDHRCNGACVVEDASSCGSACSVCPAPTSGTATCDQGACQQGCSGATHQCGSACLANNSVDHCGSSCAACVPPANSSATCNGTSCGFTCNPGFVSCGGLCVDLTTDPAHCGGCNTACSFNQLCSGSACRTACNSGAPGFVNGQALAGFTGLRAVALGQLIGDSSNDLALVDGGTAYVAKGNGAGAFAAAQLIGAFTSAPYAVIAADVNGDGIADLVGTDSMGVEPLLSKPGGGFALGTAGYGGDVFDFTLRDVNGDGRADMITVDDGRQGIGLALGTAAGFAATAFTRLDNSSFVDRVSVSVTSCALTRGGPFVAILSDYYSGTFFTGSGAGSEVTLLQVDANGAALDAPHVIYTNTKSTAAGRVAAGDFNGDGICDVVFDDDDKGTLVFLSGNGNGTFTKQTAPLQTPAAGQIAGLYPIAFNGPALASDLLVQTTLGLTFYEGGFGGLQAAGAVPAGTAPAVNAIGIVDGDAIPDLIVTTTATGTELVRGKCQ